MEKHTFPWTPHEDPPLEEPVKEPTPVEKWKTKLRPLAPYIALALILLVLGIARSSGGDTGKAEAPRGVDALVLLSPLKKGARLEEEVIRQIPIDRRDLSKAQMLQLVRPEDLERVAGKVRAKKDIPPQKPLFWSDLMIHNPVPVNTSPIKIQYSKRQGGSR